MAHNILWREREARATLTETAINCTTNLSNVDNFKYGLKLLIFSHSPLFLFICEFIYSSSVFT